MNRLASLLFGCTIVLGGAACKGKPTTQDPPLVAKGSGAMPGSNAGSAAGSGSAENNDLVLPPATKLPPNKTMAAIKPEKIKTLGALRFDTWTSIVRADGTNLVVRHTSAGRPYIQVTVDLGPCFDCLPMDLEKWKAKEAALKQIFPKGLENQPDVIFEPGVFDFNGQPMIYTYQLGQTVKKDENDNPSAVFSHAYALYFNDGINMVRVVAEYKDLPMQNAKALGETVKRSVLEIAARTFMDKYTHEW